MQLFVVLVIPLGGAQGESRHEHGEKAVAVRHFGWAVSEARNPKRYEAIARAGQLGPVWHVEQQPAERPTYDVAHHNACPELPDHADREPSPPPRLARLACKCDRNGGVDEREGQSVVQARL